MDERLAIPSRLGVMQGRLAPILDNEIQRFPSECWESELQRFSEIGFRLIEWTLDHEKLLDNPLMTSSGRAVIKQRLQDFNLQVSSVTADCVMQFPFWKIASSRTASLAVAEFMSVLENCAEMNADLVVIPLVDNSSIANEREKDKFIDVITHLSNELKDYGVKIALESDYAPAELLVLIESINLDFVGINLDVGNSASLGFDPSSEIALLHPHIFNVHLKDRKLGGSTVPFGHGDVDFEKIFTLLVSSSYRGNFILQGARAPDGLSHERMLTEYCDYCLQRGFPSV